MQSSRDMKKIWSLDFTVKVPVGAKKSVNIMLFPEEVGEYKAIAGTPLASDVSLYIAEDTTGQLYCIDNQILNEDGTVSTAIELEEGDQVKVWGYASRYLELQEGLKIVVVQPGIIERNGELVILDKNLKVD